MKSGQSPITEEATANDIAKYKPPARFKGVDNPHHKRKLHAFLSGTETRRELDNIAGTTNASELIAQPRRKGLQIPCFRFDMRDRDGYHGRPGAYYLTSEDRHQGTGWLRHGGRK